MVTTTSEIPTQRVEFLKSVLPASSLSSIDLLATSGTSKLGSTNPPDLQKVLLANDLARISQNDPLIVKPLLNDGKVQTLRDIALNFDEESLVALIASEHKPAAPSVGGEVALAGGSNQHPTGEVKSEEKTENIIPQVRNFRRRLFQEEPSAMVSRMVKTGHIPITATASKTGNSSSKEDEARGNAVKDGVVRFFEVNQPNFNIRKESILQTLADPKSFLGIEEAHKSDLALALKKLQTTQALTQTHEVLPALFKANLHTAFQVASIPQSNFLRKFGTSLGGTEIAQQIHTHATNTNIRNNEALTNMLQTLRGTGLAAIDGKETRLKRLQTVQNLPALPAQANLEKLFGSK